jgi:transcriptional regulator with XRE-family HTH domain
MSRRQAATKAGVSPSQWSDVERGHKRAGPGIVIPVQASADTLAKMAKAIGVSADELVAAGRDDAAHQLRAAAEQRLLRQQLAAVPGVGTFPDRAFPGADGSREELLPLIAHALDAIDQSRLPSGTRHDLTTVFVDNLLHDTTRRCNELFLTLRLAEHGGRPG